MSKVEETKACYPAWALPKDKYMMCTADALERHVQAYEDGVNSGRLPMQHREDARRYRALVLLLRAGEIPREVADYRYDQVARAVKEGKTVPVEVLADYPNLAKRAQRMTRRES